jgi:hypothetical protein
MSDTTQLKGFKKVVVIPVVVTVRANGEELEFQSIPDSNDDISGDLTNLFDFGIGVRERRVSSCRI